MGVGTYNYTFKSVVFESVKIKNKILRSLGMVQKSFVRRFENDTCESVFIKSVEIESVVVNAHPQCITTKEDSSSIHTTTSILRC